MTIHYTLYLPLLIAAHVAMYTDLLGQSVRPTKTRADQTIIKITNQTNYRLSVQPAAPSTLLKNIGLVTTALPDMQNLRIAAGPAIPAHQESWFAVSNLYPPEKAQYAPLLFITIYLDTANPSGRTFQGISFDKMIRVAFVYYWGYAQAFNSTPDDINIVIKPSATGLGVHIESTILNGSFKANLFTRLPGQTDIDAQKSALRQALNMPDWVMEWDSPDFLAFADPVLASA